MNYSTQSRPVHSQTSAPLRAPPSVAVCAPTPEPQESCLVISLDPNDWNLKGYINDAENNKQNFSVLDVFGMHI